MYAPNLLSVDPSDTAPPFRYRDVAAFARWAEHRRCGPGPGMLLAKALFGFEYDDRLMLSFARHEWVDAAAEGGGLGTALATLGLAIDDVTMGTDLSGELTGDLVWFMARGAMILQWMDWDRVSRLTSQTLFRSCHVAASACTWRPGVSPWEKGWTSTWQRLGDNV
jgi:hypothetical protein